MIKQDQSILYENDERVPGDCFRASLACVLELPLTQVPHFAALGAEHWFNVANLWLASEYGVTMRYQPLPLDVPKHIDHVVKEAKKKRCMFKEVLVSGLTTRLVSVRHMCVGTIDEGPMPEVLHDPHPSRAGLTQIDAFYYFVKA